MSARASLCGCVKASSRITEVDALCASQCIKTPVALLALVTKWNIVVVTVGVTDGSGACIGKHVPGHCVEERRLANTAASNIIRWSSQHTKGIHALNTGIRVPGLSRLHCFPPLRVLIIPPERMPLNCDNVLFRVYEALK